jgi:transposase
VIVDGRGVPLSIIVTAANVNDGKRLDAVLSAIVVKRKRPPTRRNKHLCADAGYRSAENLRVINDHGYIGYVVDRREEIAIKRRHPTKRARRWVVEVCHRWFNRFRKLLVRYEKLERSFVALNHLAAATIAFRKVPLSINIVYG